ncbi:hypothetical protein [Clostridium sp. OS1-26]|uniref:hypothetical protein n=1 Tax=Clostridium sp. OS1-26 TaxID=3070681 RepID=UPI0027E13DFC|nr:hypothetical protein [Clostridium sp. OS1-26]WML32862.1 hypothetical protein RCG18_16020 [Clostridium sp. OS1-26]
MYASSYNKLFWAMIFIIFDINLGSINILPNFIGYILIYSALNELQLQHKIYEKGKIPSIILTILTVKDIIHVSNDNLLSGQFAPPNFWLMALSSVILIINIYLIYIICKGIYLLCLERGLQELKDSAKNRWIAFLSVSIISIFYIPFSLNLSLQFKSAMIIFAFINIIAELSIAFLFRKSTILLES